MKTINIKDLSPDQIADLRQQLDDLDKKPTPEERLLELLDGCVRKHDFEEYPDTASFWFKDGEVIMEESKKGYLWCHYSKIWHVFESEHCYNYEEIKELIKDVVEKHFNLKGVTPDSNSNFVPAWWKSISI